MALETFNWVELRAHGNKQSHVGSHGNKRGHVVKHVTSSSQLLALLISSYARNSKYPRAVDINNPALNKMHVSIPCTPAVSPSIKGQALANVSKPGHDH